MNIKNKILMAAILTVVAFTSALGQVMDSSFTYQGELLDNGVPANGQYDINLDLIDGDLFPWGNTSEHSPVNVVNGIFSINADFDINSFNGYKDFTITVSIRKTSEGPGGAFTILGSQTVQAVPMATNLTNGAATTGQVLTFNGYQWAPVTPTSSSPWTVSGNNISYETGSVNIGDTSLNVNSTALNVQSNDELAASFNGGSNMYVYFQENGEGRGYVGSYQNPANPGISDDDFEIGTTSGSSGKMHIVTGSNNPRITVTSTGDIGINTTEPLADLHIKATSDGDVIRVQVDGGTKFYVDSNGGTSIGSWDTPPVNGLAVVGDMKQSIASNGLMKYMVSAFCSDSGASISRSYNGTSNSGITIASGSTDGECIIDFPSNINERFWQATALGVGNRGVNCTQIGVASDKLKCTRFQTTTGTGIDGSIMVLIY